MTPERYGTLVLLNWLRGALGHDAMGKDADLFADSLEREMADARKWREHKCVPTMAQINAERAAADALPARQEGEWKHDAESGAITCRKCGGHHVDSGCIGPRCQCAAPSPQADAGRECYCGGGPDVGHAEYCPSYPRFAQ
jgi:hypothetical protein